MRGLLSIRSDLKNCEDEIFFVQQEFVKNGLEANKAIYIHYLVLTDKWLSLVTEESLWFFGDRSSVYENISDNSCFSFKKKATITNKPNPSADERLLFDSLLICRAFSLLIIIPTIFYIATIQ